MTSSFKSLAGALACGLALSAAPASGALITIFSDTFDTETLGLNATPSNWTVTTGTVDIIGVGGGFDFLPGNGRYIDMDGSTSQAGTISRSFTLAPGNYLFSYDYAGNQRTSIEEGLEVKVGGFSVATHTPAIFDPFVTNSFGVQIIGGPATFDLAFTSVGPGNNFGVLLDNVLVQQRVPDGNGVPEGGSSVALLGGALLGLAGLARRARR